MKAASATNDALKSVAIIGGGWAGLACALKLARSGFNPIVYESAPEPGGRARSAKLDGISRDNGQHLMLGGCKALSTLFDEIGVLLPRAPFAYTDSVRALSLLGRPHRPNRSSLLAALFKADGFSWGERLSLLRALLVLQWRHWQVPVDLTVAQWLEAQHQPESLIHHFWAPLALAILNTPLQKASMARLTPVLRDTLGAGGLALDILQPSSDLSASIVTPLIDAINRAGGKVLCGHRVSTIETTHNGGYRLHLPHRDVLTHVDTVVLAMPPWALTQLELPKPIDAVALALAKRFGSEPIATIYLGFDTQISLPTPLVQLAGPTKADARIWAIDRAHCGEPGVIAISLSAKGPWTALDHELLVKYCLKNLQAIGINAPCRWHKVVTVKRATPCVTPTARLHDHERHPLPALWLAGDWTHPEYPATLEAAVASGFAVAAKIIANNA